MSERVRMQLPNHGEESVEAACARMNNLINARVKLLGESMENACIGVAISAIKSIRAATRKAKKAGDPPLKVEKVGLYPGYSATLRRPCLRTSPHRGASRFNSPLPVRWLTLKETPKKNSTASVFKVTPMHQRTKGSGKVGEYYAVAYNRATVVKYERTASRHRVAAAGGLAKAALGFCMAQISNRNTPEDVSQIAEKAGRMNAIVRKNGSGNSFVIDVADTLDYAMNALRGDTVSAALEKAERKMVGYLCKRAEKYFDEWTKSEGGKLFNDYPQETDVAI